MYLRSNATSLSLLNMRLSQYKSQNELKNIRKKKNFLKCIKHFSTFLNYLEISSNIFVTQSTVFLTSYQSLGHTMKMNNARSSRPPQCFFFKEETWLTIQHSTIQSNKLFRKKHNRNILLFINRFYFLEQFQVHKTLNRRYRDFPHKHSLLRYQHGYQSGMFATTDELPQTHPNHPSP